jgi:hypothetical protein
MNITIWDRQMKISTEYTLFEMNIVVKDRVTMVTKIYTFIEEDLP